MDTYTLHVAGLTRELPLCALNDKLKIAAFIMFGDVELTCRCAEELVKLASPHDVLITAEAKGIPLAYEMARQMGVNRYLVARKSPKLYMKNPTNVAVKSITTAATQRLYIDEDDAKFMKGRRVLIVDDVISTGESVGAVEALIEKAGGQVAGRMAVLAEGDAAERKDIVYLAPLPLFPRK